MPAIDKARILIVATDGFERSELFHPLEALRERGATVEVATPGGQSAKSWDKTDWGDSVEADLDVATVEPRDYDAIVLPGGQINPDILRTKPEAVALVRAFHDDRKTVAAVCHGPWLLIEAGIAEGREMTSWPSVRTDLKNAGAKVVDREAVTDGHIVTSRNPDDLPAFVDAIVASIEAGAARAQNAA